MDLSCRYPLLVLGQQADSIASSVTEALFFYAAVDVKNKTNERTSMSLLAAIAVICTFFGVLCRGDAHAAVDRVTGTLRRTHTEAVDATVAEYMLCNLVTSKKLMNIAMIAVAVLFYQVADVVTREMGSAYVYTLYPFAWVFLTLMSYCLIGAFKRRLRFGAPGELALSTEL